MGMIEMMRNIGGVRKKKVVQNLLKMMKKKGSMERCYSC